MKIVIDGQEVELSVGGGGGGVPKGSIIIWSGAAADIPEGWALCDGQDGRPDLRDRFVLGGGGTHAVGDTGGEETHTLTVEEMPMHSHGVRMSTGEGTFTAITTKGDTGGVINTTNVGGSQPHNNMPPYYVLCYIVKVTEGGGGSSEEVYSTEEKRIGTWVDGKPLYRITIPVHVTNRATSQNLGTIGKSIKHAYGKVVEDTHKYVFPIPYAQSDSSGKAINSIGVGGIENEETYVFLFSPNEVSATGYVTLEYTKTTD